MYLRIGWHSWAIDVVRALGEITGSKDDPCKVLLMALSQSNKVVPLTGSLATTNTPQPLSTLTCSIVEKELVTNSSGS